MKGLPQYRHTEGQGRRKLLTPDEVLRFPDDELLIILRGQNVLRAKKFDYTGHPYAKKMIRTSIFDYNPQNSQTVSQGTASASTGETTPVPHTETETQKQTSVSQDMYGAWEPPSEF